MPITSTLTAFFRRPGINPSSILAGVSGGADSVALVSLLHHYREELGIERLAIAHVNHGLRGEESDGDEEFVKNLSARLDIDFYRTLLHPDPENTGIEDWARRHRYDFFRSVAKDHGFAHIATAHTANDQAETVLMRLMRGTGVRGLRGVLPVRGDGVIRPLLEVERQELLEWLGARGLTFREDSSNAEDLYRRNFVRNRIIPLLLEINSGAVANIAAGALSAGRAWGVIEGRVEEWINTYVLRVNEGVFHVEKAGAGGDAAGEGEIASEALLSLFEDYGISSSRLHIDRVMEALGGGMAGGEHLLPDGWRFYPRGDRVCFVRVDG